MDQERECGEALTCELCEEGKNEVYKSTLLIFIEQEKQFSAFIIRNKNRRRESLLVLLSVSIESELLCCGRNAYLLMHKQNLYYPPAEQAIAYFDDITFKDKSIDIFKST